MIQNWMVLVESNFLDNDRRIVFEYEEFMYFLGLRGRCELR